MRNTFFFQDGQFEDFLGVFSLTPRLASPFAGGGGVPPACARLDFSLKLLDVLGLVNDLGVRASMTFKMRDAHAACTSMHNQNHVDTTTHAQTHATHTPMHTRAQHATHISA